MQNKGLKIYYWLSYTIFICLFITFICFINQRIDYLIDSDMSSEMVLAEIIANSGKLLNHDWYYSTELRVFYMQLFMTPLFYFVSDWHVIRVVATVLMICVFLASAFFFMYSINQHKFFPIVASILVLPFSTKYFEYVIYGLYYTPNIILALNILALMFITLKSKNKTKKAVFISLALILSLIAGLCGIRNLVNIFAPIGISSFILFIFNIKKENFNTYKNFLILSIIVCAIGCIGASIYYFYLSNSFGLSKFGYDNDFKFTFNKNGVRDIVFAFFNMLGLIIESNIYLEITLFVLLIIMFVLAFKKSSNLSLREKAVALYVLITICIYSAIHTFTTMSYTPKYLVPTSVFMVFVVVALLRNLTKTKLQKSFCVILYCILCVPTLIDCTINYSKLWKTDNSYNQREILTKILEYDCYEGYASFWNGNILTELSDGKVRVRHFSPYESNETNIDNSYKWLQQKSLIESKPEEKVFVLFTLHEYENFALADYFVDETYLMESNETYKLFIYPSYDEMVRVTGVGHNF